MAQTSSRPARAQHDFIIHEAETFPRVWRDDHIFHDELFWGGDRIDMLIERIKNPASAATALAAVIGSDAAAASVLILLLAYMERSDFTERLNK